MAYSTIEDPSEYFQTALYTGNGSTQSITNDGNSDMQPDWVWVKSRSIAYHNVVFDSSRGVNQRLSTNLTAAEDTGAGYGTVSAFNSDGFSVSSGANTNNNSATYVAWQWKANGGTTAANSDGSLASVVQADTTAGFSIVTWTGAGGVRTVGHGLGVAPDVIIVKNRSTSTQWGVWHKNLADTDKNLRINSTSAEVDDALWNDTVPTSSVFSIGSSAEVSGNSIAYCFAEKQGYSKFGKYVGNGNANGSFVYTGFKPAFVMVKAITSSKNWDISTGAVSSNQIDERLRANLADAEESSGHIDFLSNGFKMRNTNGTQNSSGVTYIYMAFAESPFVAEGVPTTAR